MKPRQNLLPGGACTIALMTAGVAADAADLVQTLQDQQQFGKLAKALDDADLRDALEGEGPFTVFAPTDQAFEQLSEQVGDVQSIIKV